MRVKNLTFFRTLRVPDPRRMQSALAVITDIWYAHELKFDNDFEAARRRLQHALELDPTNQYLRYLLAKVEQKSKATRSPRRTDREDPNFVRQQSSCRFVEAKIDRSLPE